MKTIVIDAAIVLALWAAMTYGFVVTRYSGSGLFASKELPKLHLLIKP
jgi:TRAP-type C4-dicarboxylate transport system permease small subunit